MLHSLLAGPFHDNLPRHKLFHQEDALQRVVDPQRRMFDVTTTSSTGCRVAIITSRTFLSRTDNQLKSTPGFLSM
jgi:hypothetical protein